MPSSKPERVDVVIVGIGASGGTAAMVLSEGGLTVVGLDRGPWSARQALLRRRVEVRQPELPRA